MKAFIASLIICLILISCDSERNKIEGSWILVKQESKPGSRFNPVLRGLLVNFRKDTLEYSHVTALEIIKEPYYIKENLIQTDSSVFGKIIHVCKDSLIIEEDTNSYNMHFRPILKGKLGSNQKQEVLNKLIYSSWIIDSEDYYAQLFFDTTSWGAGHKDNKSVKCVVFEDGLGRWKQFSEYEWWTLKEFKDNLFLAYSYGQFESCYFQILDHGGESMTGIYLNWYDHDWRSINMKMAVQISAQEIQNRREKIIGNWKLIELLNSEGQQFNFKKDSLKNWGLGRNFNELRFLKSDLENKTISYQFKDNGQYLIKAANRIIRKGELWDLTKDGKFIYLDSKSTGNNFIQLINVDLDELEISKRERIDIGGKLNSKFGVVKLYMKFIKE